MSDITLGVPRGLVLGPVVVYINDLFRSSNRVRFVHFAYDTTVFASDSDINNVHATVLVGVSNWLKANRLSLNVSKTSNMISNQLRTMASETVDPIDWSHPPPYTGQYPLNSTYCTLQCGLQITRFAALSQPRTCDFRMPDQRTAGAATQGVILNHILDNLLISHLYFIILSIEMCHLVSMKMIMIMIIMNVFDVGAFTLI